MSTEELLLVGYTDSDFASDKADRKSQGGYIFKDVTGETTSHDILALKTIYSGVSSPKTKHIDIRYHVSRDRQERGIVNFTDISTDDNLADIMTKALSPDKHQTFTTGIGLCFKI
jgi:hypothetical protein